MSGFDKLDAEELPDRAMEVIPASGRKSHRSYWLFLAVMYHLAGVVASFYALVALNHHFTIHPALSQYSEVMFSTLSAHQTIPVVGIVYSPPFVSVVLVLGGVVVPLIAIEHILRYYRYATSTKLVALKNSGGETVVPIERLEKYGKFVEVEE